MTKSARWEKRGYLFTKEPVETRSIITVCPFYSNSHLFLSDFRHRSYLSGLNLRSVLRMWLELWHCLQVENESPAPPVTLVSITMTRPHAHHVHLGPFPMAWNVLKTFYLTVLICLPLTFCFMRFPNCVFHCLSPACQQCPAGSEPTLGYEYKWWNVLPSNMKTSCFNVGNSKCDSMNGRCLWQDMPTFALSLNSGLFCHCIVWWLQWSESKSMANIWLPLATRTNRNTHTTLTATLTPRPPPPPTTTMMPTALPSPPTN